MMIDGAEFKTKLMSSVWFLRCHDKEMQMMKMVNDMNLDGSGTNFQLILPFTWTLSLDWRKLIWQVTLL